MKELNPRSKAGAFKVWEDSESAQLMFVHKNMLQRISDLEQGIWNHLDLDFNKQCQKYWNCSIILAYLGVELDNIVTIVHSYDVKLHYASYTLVFPDAQELDFLLHTRICAPSG